MKGSSTETSPLARITSEREWWRLQPSDLATWLATLPHSARDETSDRANILGASWDGSADFTFGGSAIAVAEINQLLEDLRAGIPCLGMPDARLPDHRSVRFCKGTWNDRPALTIDIELGDLILPLCIEASELEWGERIPMPKVAANMLGLIRAARDLGRRMAPRELRMRQALEETVSFIGAGAAPLWMRLEPFPHFDNAKHLPTAPYAALFTMLDRCLVWAPTGSDRIQTVKDVRSHRWERSNQRRRSDAQARITARASTGLISDVAAALMEDYGLVPLETLSTAMADSLAGRKAAIELTSDGRRETLSWADGCLQAHLELGAGLYSPGQTILWGHYPDSLALGLKGRQMA